MSEKAWRIRRLKDTPPVQCMCGEARRILTGGDNDLVSIHRVSIRGRASKHYHRDITEYYIVLEGEGEMELDDERVPVGPGDVIMIPPGTRHALRGHCEIINVVSPPFNGQDEIPAE
jgi:mannose-6-phosphate isomerase-like protein (cupin superfamily)